MHLSKLVRRKDGAVSMCKNTHKHVQKESEIQSDIDEEKKKNRERDVRIKADMSPCL